MKSTDPGVDDQEWLDLRQVIRQIVDSAYSLATGQTADWPMKASWCCIFTQTQKEFSNWTSLAESRGILAKETKNGPVCVIPPIATDAGLVRVVEVRAPDEIRVGRGDADFRVEDQAAFKSKFRNRDGFSLMERQDFEMIELLVAECNTRAYFSNPPVEQHDGIRHALESIDS